MGVGYKVNEYRIYSSVRFGGQSIPIYLADIEE